jgi:hypothetical protein
MNSEFTCSRFLRVSDRRYHRNWQPWPENPRIRSRSSPIPTVGVWAGRHNPTPPVISLEAAVRSSNREPPEQRVLADHNGEKGVWMLATVTRRGVGGRERLRLSETARMVGGRTHANSTMEDGGLVAGS